MRPLNLSLLLGLLSLACTDPIQRSHINANVPDRGDFDRILHRDLESYFANDRKEAGVSVAFEFLREGPTQTGIAFPKYYLWVRIGEGARPEDRGAVRVAAVEKQQFEVTHFLSEAEIRRNGAIEQVFPPAVCDRIRTRLRQ